MRDAQILEHGQVSLCFWWAILEGRLWMFFTWLYVIFYQISVSHTCLSPVCVEIKFSVFLLKDVFLFAWRILLLSMLEKMRLVCGIYLFGELKQFEWIIEKWLQFNELVCLVVEFNSIICSQMDCWKSRTAIYEFSNP